MLQSDRRALFLIFTREIFFFQIKIFPSGKSKKSRLCTSKKMLQTYRRALFLIFTREIFFFRKIFSPDKAKRSRLCKSDNGIVLLQSFFFFTREIFFFSEKKFPSGKMKKSRLFKFTKMLQSYRRTLFLIFSPLII